MKTTMFQKAKAMFASMAAVFNGPAQAVPMAAGPIGAGPTEYYYRGQGRPGIQAYRAWRKKRRQMRAASIRAHRS